jgi:hypothetical protein
VDDAANGGIKACKPQWDLGHPPQKTDRAVRVHVIFTRLMCALATAWVPPKADIDLAFLPIPEDCR